MIITGSGDVSSTVFFTAPLTGHYLCMARAEVDDVVLDPGPPPGVGYGYYTLTLSAGFGFFFDTVGPYSVDGPYPRVKRNGSASVFFMNAGDQLSYSAAKLNVLNDPNFTLELRVGLVGFADLTL